MSFTHDIQIPRVEDEMKGGVLERWLVSDGDRVEMGDPLFELSTDHCVFEIESFQAGIVRITAPPHTEYLVDHVVGVVEFTEQDRLQHYHLGIGLNYQQRLALKALCGDMDERSWMLREFKQVIASKLGK